MARFGSSGIRGLGNVDVTPELALVGYLPRDLLLSDGFVRRSWEALAGLAVSAPQPPGSTTKRVCRTRHGPVEARAGNVAYARRYAGWNRELETLDGLAALNDARDIHDVDAALPARTAGREHELAAVEIALRIGQQKSDLQGE